MGPRGAHLAGPRPRPRRLTVQPPGPAPSRGGVGRRPHTQRVVRVPGEGGVGPRRQLPPGEAPQLVVPVASLVCGDTGRLSWGSGGRGGSGRARAVRPLRVCWVWEPLLSCLRSRPRPTPSRLPRPPGPGGCWGSVRSRGPSGSSGRRAPPPRSGRDRTRGLRAGCGC